MGNSKKCTHLLEKILQANSFRDSSLVNWFHGFYQLDSNRAPKWSAMKRCEIPPNFFERHLCISVTPCDAKDQAFYFQAKYHMAGGTVSILLRSPHLTNSRIMSKFYLRDILTPFALHNQKRTAKCDYLCNSKWQLMKQITDSTLNY